MTTPWQRAIRSGGRIGHAIEVHDAIGSTNDRARELLDAGRPEGVAVVAELQTAGRGRRGRTWTSPPGVNLMVSIGLRPRIAADAAREIVPAAALAAWQACRAVTGDVWLKWPNDLVTADGAKLGGILVEVASHAEGLRHAVLGFGLNVNWRSDDMPVELRETATSLRELTGMPVDRVALLRELLASLEHEIAALEVGSSPVPRYRAACRTIGTTVVVDTPNGRIEGRAVDIGDDGTLAVETDAGRVAVTSGEVRSVRARDTA